MKISPFIQNLKPYVAGKSIEEVQREYGLKEIVKLASNENALGPNPKVLEAARKALTDIHRYPDASYITSKKIIATHFKVQPNNISLGNGSNELIDMLIRVFCEPNQDEILISQASFIAYKVCAHVNRVNVTEVPIKKNFQMDIEAMANALTDKHKIIFLPNPNNPTGMYISRKELEPLLNKVRGRGDVLLVIDEAYNEFVRAADYPNSQSLFKEFKNVVVLRTFAKVHGLAGLRLGFMMADPHIVDLLERIRLPFNVSNITASTIDVALNDSDYIKKSQEVVWQGLEYFESELKNMGLEYCPSQGNFIFFDLKADSSLIFEELLKRGVILRPVKNYGFPTHMRMSVGTMAENKKAIESLKEVLKNI
ncbi:MAG: histidinol-phosphate transaminase [Bdellovibrionota bacterium]